MELKESKSSLSNAWSIIKTQRNAFSGGSIQHMPNEDMLVCLLDENIAFLDLKTGVVEGTLLPEREETNEQIVCFILNKDGSQIFYATRNQLLHQYDLIMKHEIKFWKAHEGPIHSMALDSSGKYLITGSADHTAKVWDIEGGYCTHNFKHPFGVVHLVHFSVSTSPFYAYTCCDDNIIRIWDLNGDKKNQLVCECKSHLNTVTDMDISEDLLITCSRDKTISIWDVYKGTLIKTFLAYEQIESIHLLNSIECLQLGVSNSSSYNIGFIVAGEYGYLRTFQGLYSKVNGKETYSIQEIDKSDNDSEIFFTNNTVATEGESSSNNVNNKSILPNLYSIKNLFVYTNELTSETTAYAITNDNMIKQYHYLSKHIQYFGSIVGYNDDIIDICFIGQDTNRIAVVSNVNYIRLLDLTTFSSVFLYGHTSTILSVKCSKNGQYLISSSKDKTIKLWHIPTLTCLCTCTGHIQDVTNIDIEPKENAVSKQYLKKVFMYALKQKYIIYHDEKKQENVEKEADEIVNQPDTQIFPHFFVSVSEDKTIKYWNTDNIINGFIDGAEKTVKGHEKSINTIVIAPNGRICATASQDKTIKIWSLPELVELSTYSGHRRGVWDIHFSPINSILLSCSVDGCFRLWNVKENLCIKNVEAADTSLLRCAFVKNGEQIFTCDSAGVIRLYNTFTTELVNTFEGHSDKIWTIAISPLDRIAAQDDTSRETFVTGGADGVIHVWSDTTAEERAREIEKKEEEYQKQQELNICMYKRKWRRAVQLCFELNYPKALRRIIETISIATIDENNIEHKEDMDSIFIPILKKLTKEQKILLFNYIRDWNAIGRTSLIAHTLLDITLKCYTNEDIASIPEIKEILEAIDSYTIRHYQRINRLLQSSYLIDYCLSNMNSLNPNMSFYTNTIKPVTEKTLTKQTDTNKRVLEDDEKNQKVKN